MNQAFRESPGQQAAPAKSSRLLARLRSPFKNAVSYYMLKVEICQRFESLGKHEQETNPQNARRLPEWRGALAWEANRTDRCGH